MQSSVTITHDPTYWNLTLLSVLQPATQCTVFPYLVVPSHRVEQELVDSFRQQCCKRTA